jgi:predicted amidophosphoribosyltransferase
VQVFLPPRCPTCGAPAEGIGDVLATGCALCRAEPLTGIERAGALGAYEGSLRRIVHALKFRRHPSVARVLARRLACALPELIGACDAVVPVPLHGRRRRERGFNQAEEIARHLGPPVLGALRRTRATRPQSELDARTRRHNVADAFALAPWLRVGRRLGALGTGGARSARQPLEDRRLLLVDDVWTTGATLSACAAALRGAGVREVYAVVIARAVPPRLR